MADRTLYLDIETIPVQSEAERARIWEGISPPANMTKQATIDAWWADKGRAATEKAVAETSFDPAKGHICCIGWAVDDGIADSVQMGDVGYERVMLIRFFDNLNSMNRYTFVGHNIAAFDLRFLLCRAVALGVHIPKCIPRDLKPWDARIFDTMHAWAGARGTISLDNLCRALDIPGKGDFDGSQVAAAWDAQEVDKIAEYCRADVERVRAVHRKFMEAGW